MKILFNSLLKFKNEGFGDWKSFECRESFVGIGEVEVRKGEKVVVGVGSVMGL